MSFRLTIYPDIVTVLNSESDSGDPFFQPVYYIVQLVYARYGWCIDMRVLKLT